MSPTEPGTIKAVLETLFKPVTLILNPLAERIGNRFKRKPKLHIFARPRSPHWCYAWEGASLTPMMQLHFSADITNDGNEGVLILDAYVKGTKSKLPLIARISIPPGQTLMGANIVLMVAPVVGHGGKNFTGKVILIDQLKR